MDRGNTEYIYPGSEKKNLFDLRERERERERERVNYHSFIKTT